MEGKKIEKVQYINIVSDETEDSYWIDNSPIKIVGYIQAHFDEFLIFYDVDNTRLFHWNGKGLFTSLSQLLLYPDIEEYKQKITRLLTKSWPEPTLYQQVGRIGDNYLCLYKQIVQGDDSFPFLSASIDASDDFLDMLRKNQLDKQDFTMDVIFMLITVFNGIHYPQSTQKFKYNNQKFKVELRKDSNTCYFDI